MAGLMQSLKACSRAAEVQKLHERHVRMLFEQRYGKDLSDADCDPVIDMVSGQSDVFCKNIKELDAIVFEYCGLKPRGSK